VIQRGSPLAVLRAIIGAWALLSARQRVAAVSIAVLSIVSSLTELAALSTTVPFISVLMDRDGLQRYPLVAGILERIGIGADDAGVTWIGVAVVVALAVATAFRFATAWAVEFFSLRLTNSLVRSVLNRTIRAPYLWLKGQNVAALSQRITADAATVGQTIYPVTLDILYALVTMLLGLAIVLANAPGEALLAILGIALVGVCVISATNPATARQAAAFRDRVVESNRIAFETFSVHKQIKVASAEEPFVRRYVRAFRASNRARLLLTMMNKAVPMLTLLLGQVGLIVVALALVYSNLAREELVAQLTLVVVVVARILPTVSGLSGSMNKLIKAMPHYDGMRRLLAELDDFERVKDAVPGRPVPDWKTLALSHVGFRHAGSGRQQISDLSLEFRRGGRYGIVGPSGAGKSTLVDLVLRLIEPTSGEITLDGTPASAISRSAWLSRIGYVAQEVPIVDDTVRRNVAFSTEEAHINDAAVWRVLEIAGLAADVRAMPGGISARVGEGGGRLSGGQRQRIAIARALYGGADLLVLDEATSGLDPATEASVLANLLSLPNRITLVMVTHRLATTGICDEVFVIADGGVVARGAYASVMADPSVVRILGGGVEPGLATASLLA